MAFGDAYRDPDGTVLVELAPYRTHAARTVLAIAETGHSFVGAASDLQLAGFERLHNRPSDGGYEFVGGPYGGMVVATGGSHTYTVIATPAISFSVDDEIDSTPTYSAFEYELRRDGRYHLKGK